MATVLTHISRTYDDALQQGTVLRDTTLYPVANDPFYAAVNRGEMAINVINPSTGATLFVIPAVTSGYTFQGIQQGGYPSTDLDFLAITLEFRNGRVYATDHSFFPGHYLINSNRYRDSLAGTHFPPGLPILFQKFDIISGRAEGAYRDQPVRNASQLIRVL